MRSLHAFLLTDIVGSTKATRADAGAMRALLTDHDDVLLHAVTAAGGRVFKHTGDGICAVFDDPADAVASAVASQRSLVRLGARVRMGIDVGVVQERGADYFGLTLNRCREGDGLGSRGQVLVTLAVEELLTDGCRPTFLCVTSVWSGCATSEETPRVSGCRTRAAGGIWNLAVRPDGEPLPSGTHGVDRTLP